MLRRALRPLLLLGALLLAMQRAPGAEARDEARLKAQLAEAFGAVDQSRAIQDITNKLTAELGRKADLTLFGAQARAAARGILSALVTSPRGCLQWDCAVPGSGAQSWVASSSSVREAVARGFQRQGGPGPGKEVFFVVENMDRIDCSNIMYLNNIMAVISEYAEARRQDGPTFLFLFETDVDRRALLERGVKAYWVEQIEEKCQPGPALNLKAFFGRLSELILAPLPSNLVLAPRDTQPLCKGLPQAGGGLFGGGKILMFACLGLVVAGTAYAITRAGGKGGGGDDKGHTSRKGNGDAAHVYTPVIGDSPPVGGNCGGFGAGDEAERLPFAPTAVKGGATVERRAGRGKSGGAGGAAASARAMAASVSPEDGRKKASGARRASTRSKTPVKQR